MNEHHQVHAELPGSNPDYVVALRARQHPIASDEPASLGGSDKGPRPFELVLAGLASCTAITIRMYAGRKQWPLGDVRVGISMRKDGAAFQILRTVELGGGLSEEQRSRIAEICEKTPVTLFAKQGATIRTEVRTVA